MLNGIIKGKAKSLYSTGSIVPVAPGRMRNIWYPGKRAEYVTAAQLRGMDDVVIERDFTFGMEKEVEAQEALKDDTAVEMQLLAVSRVSLGVSLVLTLMDLKPQRATELLDSLVPQYLDFYRPPIRTPEPEQDTTLLRTRTAASQAAADFAAASAPDPKPVPISIYGSVSTADIATNIKVALAPKVAYDADVGRIVLSAEDIKLSHDDETAEDQERIKTLGDFQVDITVKGGQAVRRTVRVKAQQ